MDRTEHDNRSVDKGEDAKSALVIAVPAASTGGGSGHYLRLGRSMHADETVLHCDPAAGEKPGLLIEDVTPRSPFPAGQLGYSTGAIQFVAPHGYLRLGTATEYEGWMSPVPGQPLQPGTAGLAGGKGVLIATPDTVQTVAKQILRTSVDVTDYTTDTLEIVGDDTHLVSARRSWGAADNSSSATFTRTNSYAAQLGSNVQMLTGNTVTQYLGNLAQVGLGGYLTANYGSTQSVYGGQIVAVNFGTVEVSGWQQAKLGSNFDLAAVGAARFTSSPIAAAASETGAALAARGAMVVAMLSAITDGALDIAATAGTATAYHGTTTAGEDMRGAMERASDEMISVEAMVTLLQGMAVAAGLMTRMAATAIPLAPHAGIEITPAGVLLEALGDRLWLSGIGIYATSPILNYGAVYSMFG